VRILVVGDTYMPVEVFERVFAPLQGVHEIRYAQIDATRVLAPATTSEQAIREYEGHPAQLVELLDDDDVLVFHGAPVTDAVLDAAPSLSLLCCARGGPVNVDLEAATTRGIPVVTTPGKNAQSVAELTIAFLVMLARGISGSQRFLLDGGQLGESTFEGARFFGHDLSGDVLGLVGFGQVGQRVAGPALAFGMHVLVSDPYLTDVPDGVEAVRTLEELLARADYVSLHARATAETENLFGEEEFAAMKPGASFVNSARETLVDEDALEAALRSGHVAAAALDVVRPRPDGSRHPLLDLEQVVITPHIGGATHQTLARGARMLVDDIERVAGGVQAVNVINRQVLVQD
jgi:D-3-phosphoglycerate dehydrogenase / 2-oxoglutarate reductase